MTARLTLVLGVIAVSAVGCARAREPVSVTPAAPVETAAQLEDARIEALLNAELTDTSHRSQVDARASDAFVQRQPSTPAIDVVYQYAKSHTAVLDFDTRNKQDAEPILRGHLQRLTQLRGQWDALGNQYGTACAGATRTVVQVGNFVAVAATINATTVACRSAIGSMITISQQWQAERATILEIAGQHGIVTATLNAMLKD
jgi:hypothetical protein